MREANHKMLYTLCCDISYTKRNSDYYIASLSSMQYYRLIPPASIIVEGIIYNVSFSSILKRLRYLGYNKTNQITQKILEGLTLKKIIKYDKNKVVEQNTNFEKKNIEYIHEEKFFINKAGLVLTGKCNFKCIHCYNENYYKEQHSEMSIDKWKNVINELKDLGCMEIMITGGEPFLYPHIFEILSYLESHNIMFSILTNGTLLNERHIEALGQYKMLRNVTVSLYGTKDETYKKITRGSYTVATVAKTVSKLKKNKVNVIAKYIFMKPNFEDAKTLDVFEETYDIIIDKSYTHIYTTLSGDVKSQLTLSLENIKELHDIKCLKIIDGCNPTIQCGRERCSINFNGDVAICEKLQSITFGNVNKKSLVELWKGKELEDFLQLQDLCALCVSCKRKKYCYRCNGLSYIESGNINSRIPSMCEFAKSVVSWI